MNKEQFLNELKSKILSLTDEERNEALQYYSDYFDEAGDDEKVIKELGTPDDVAKIIIEKFASVPAATQKKTSGDDSERVENESSRSNYDEALYFTFEKNEVKNLIFDFGAANVVMISGNAFEIETRGVSESDFNCVLDSKGTLSVSNARRIPTFGFFSHDRKRRVCPKILITIPSCADVYSLKMKIGAGSIVTKNIDVSFQDGSFEVGAGNLVVGNITGSKTNIRCGMGNFEMTGSLRGKTNVDCGMGSVKLKLRGNEADYSYDCKVGLGEVRVNGQKVGIVAQSYAQAVKDNHLSVNCGMGSVNVKISNE